MLVDLLRTLKPFNEEFMSELQLWDRLEDIEKLHGGHIPLHSRLLQQWLHFIYPQDCKYPHIAGKTAQVLVDVWTNMTGKPPIITKEEIQELSKSWTKLTLDPQRRLNMWTMDEELIDDDVNKVRRKSKPADDKVALEVKPKATMRREPAVAVLEDHGSEV